MGSLTHEERARLEEIREYHAAQERRRWRCYPPAAYEAHGQRQWLLALVDRLTAAPPDLPGGVDGMADKPTPAGAAPAITDRWEEVIRLCEVARDLANGGGHMRIGYEIYNAILEIADRDPTAAERHLVAAMEAADKAGLLTVGQKFAHPRPEQATPLKLKLDAALAAVRTLTVTEES